MSASLQPTRLRPRSDLVSQRVHYGGRAFWNLKDPLSLRFYQLRDEEYFLLEQLDGRTSLHELQQRFHRRFAPQRVTAEQLHRFLAMLHHESLVLADGDDQGEQLLARRRRAGRRDRWSRISNVLAIRLRGVDPTPLFDVLYPRCRWMLHPISLVLVALLVVAAFGWALLQLETLVSRLPSLSTFFSVSNLALLVVSLAVVKAIHELAHGLVCRHFGGQCRELGVMFLVFTPCLYCNVSDAWLLSDKWRRMAISAAGMGAEFVIAGAALFGWWFSEPGLFHAVCLNLVVVCSLATLFFNGNPLLRYDGYFILADWLETPNLNEQATVAARRVLAGWVLGIDLPPSPMDRTHRRGWLIAYAVVATLYRWFLVAGILWVCYEVLSAYRLLVVWQLLVATVLAGLVVPPVWRLVRFVHDPRRRRQIRSGRAAIALLAAIALVGGLLAIPLPRRVTAPALLQPANLRQVYVSEPGTLVEMVRPGSRLESGDVVARLEDLELASELARLAGEVAVQQLRVTTLEKQQVHDPRAGVEGARGRLPAARETLRDLQARLDSRREARERLTVRAPRDGIVLPARARFPDHLDHELPAWSGTPLAAHNQGCFLERGTLLCQIGEPQQLQALLIVPHHDLAGLRLEQRVRLRLAELTGLELRGEVVEIAVADVEQLPPELLAGRLVAAQEGPQRRPTFPSYEVRVMIDSTDQSVPARLAAQSSVAVEPASLFSRVQQYLHRTFSW